MALPRRIRKRMYGVSLEGTGMIPGTLAYSRRAAIWHFLGGTYQPKDWEQCKRSGYRTVEARVATINRADHQ